jgi:diguanylate cyclase (GGDEF)-like protein
MSASAPHLERYLSLLKSLAPKVEGLMFVDREGELHCARDGTPGGRGAERALARLQPHEWQPVNGCLYRAWHGGMALARELQADNGERVGTLIVRMRGSERQLETITAMSGTLNGLAECVTAEQGLQRDLEVVTAELIERYEELNLVYKTADASEHDDEYGDALQQLVRNTRDHLNIDLVALLVPDKGIEFHAADGSGGVGDPRELIQTLRGRACEWIAAHSTTLVLNEPDEALRAELVPGFTGKLLACPLADSRGLTIGALILVNESRRADFSNGDRNLASVMAGKAAKILLASHDALTGLITRGVFEYHLAASMAVARRGQASCLLYVNIDQLHVYNDTLGRNIGDELIRQVAVLMRSELRGSDIVARLGGDEFGALLQGCALDRGRAVAEKLRKLVAGTSFSIDGKQITATVSVGVATLDRESASIITALASAEVACQAARDQGRDRVIVYQADDIKLAERTEQMHWVSRLQNALREDSFLLYAQAIEPLRPGAPPHVEVLLRLKDADGSVLAPASFIPAAERYHLMPAIDRWVIRHTLATLAQCGPESFPAVVSINLSGQSLTETGFLEFVIDELRRHPGIATRICFELTETAAISNIDEARRFINALKEESCRFALDDFGAGLSSFAYLKSLPVDYLKIDGCFVKEILADRVSQSIVAAINHIGHSLNLATVAEFVESDPVKVKLRDLGVDYAQGYGIGRPRPLVEHATALSVPARATG